MTFVHSTHSKTPCSFRLGMIMGLLLLLLFGQGWGSCELYSCCDAYNSYGGGLGAVKMSCRDSLVGGFYRSNGTCGTRSGVCAGTIGTETPCGNGTRQSYVLCSTLEEALQEGCKNNPSAPGCRQPPRDTTFTYCKESIKLMTSGQYEWYVSVLNCRGQYDPNDKKITFDELRDCGSGMEVPGSCADHGYKTGFNGGDGAPGKDVKCFAISSDGTVWLQSPSGEAFPCKGADGSCEIAQQKVMRGECTDGVDRTSSSSGASSSSSSSSDGSSSSSDVPGSSSSSSDDSETCDVCQVYAGVLGHMDNDLHENNAYLQSINKYTQWNYNATYQVAQNTSQIAATNSQIAQNTSNLLSGVGEVNSSLVQIKDAMNVQYTPETDNNDYSVDTTTAPIIDPEDQARNDSMMSFVMAERSMVDSIRRDFDSTMRRIDSIRADTNNNYMAMDSIYNWADTNTVKEKLGKIFLPTTTTNTCFVCDKQIELFNYKARLYIDFGNFKGFDLCSFVRAVVRFITAIIVTFTTVKSFIRAFSSGGGNT